LLSGLLKCGDCGYNYVVMNAKQLYACSSFNKGANCDNRLRVPRELAESTILTTVKTELLAPELIDHAERYLEERLASRLNKRPAIEQELRAALAQTDKEVRDVATV